MDPARFLTFILVVCFALFQVNAQLPGTCAELKHCGRVASPTNEPPVPRPRDDSHPGLWPQGRANGRPRS